MHTNENTYQKLILVFSIICIYPTTCEVFECENFSDTKFLMIKTQTQLLNIKSSLNTSWDQLCVFEGVYTDQNMVMDFIMGKEVVEKNITSIVFINSDISSNQNAILFYLCQKFNHVKNIALNQLKFNCHGVTHISRQPEHSQNTETIPMILLIFAILHFIFNCYVVKKFYDIKGKHSSRQNSV